MRFVVGFLAAAALGIAAYGVSRLESPRPVETAASSLLSTGNPVAPRENSRPPVPVAGSSAPPVGPDIEDPSRAASVRAKKSLDGASGAIRTFGQLGCDVRAAQRARRAALALMRTARTAEDFKRAGDAAEAAIDAALRSSRTKKPSVPQRKKTAVARLGPGSSHGKAAVHLRRSGSRQSASRRKKSARVYVVRPGDTLWKIARKTTGRGNNWGKIFRANRKILPPSGSLSVGLSLRIPS